MLALLGFLSHSVVLLLIGIATDRANRCHVDNTPLSIKGSWALESNFELNNLTLRPSSKAKLEEHLCNG